MKSIISLLVLFPVVLFSAPTLEWGLMIGDDPNAPAGYRSSDLEPYDFTVIVKITADSINGIDTAKITLGVDTANGFKLPIGETETKTVLNIERGASKWVFWNVVPPIVGQEYVGAVTASGEYSINGNTVSFTNISRDINVQRVLLTKSLNMKTINIHDLLENKYSELRNVINLTGTFSTIIVLGYFLSNYNMLQINDVETDLPNATGERQTLYHTPSGVPDGNYNIIYKLVPRTTGVISFYTYIYCMTGNWRGTDGETQGVGIDSLRIYKQGFTGQVADYAADSIPNIPISLYTCQDSLYDDRMYTFSDGSFSFGVNDAGLYKVFFNDTSRSEYDSQYASILDDNSGDCFDLGIDSVVTVDIVLDTIPNSIRINDVVLDNNIIRVKNPLLSKLALSYHLDKRCNVEISLYDSNGDRLETIVSTLQSPGEKNLVHNIKQYKSGVYYIRFKAGSIVRAYRLVILK